MGLVLKDALAERVVTGKGNGMLCPYCKAEVNSDNSWIYVNWMGECKLCKCWFNLI